MIDGNIGVVMMNKLLAMVVSCAMFGLTACGGGTGNNSNNASASGVSGSQNTNSGKVLRVGSNPEFAPFESLDENQKIQGFDVDILKAIAEANGFSVEFRTQPWDSLFPALANGDVDVLASGITITDDRKKTMDFSEPYYQITQVVLVPESREVNSIEDLKKIPKVGVATGQTGDFAAQKLFGATSPNIARLENVPLLIKEVETGGVDAAISDSAVIANHVKNNPNKGFKIIKLPDFDVENYGIAVRKGDTETLNMINDGLKKIRENGKYAEIEAKYFAAASNATSASTAKE